MIVPEAPASLLRRAASRLDGRWAPIKDERWDYDKFDDDEPHVVLLDIEVQEWVDDDTPPTVATTGPTCRDGDRAAWIALGPPGCPSPIRAAGSRRLECN